MRRILQASGLFVTSLVAVASLNANTPIAGSRHDFTVGYYGGATVVSMCSTCHEMHKPLKMEPLWARQNPSNTASWSVNSHGAASVLPAAYIPPAVSTNTAGTKQPVEWFVNGRTGLCLSCHDGTQVVASGLVMRNETNGAEFARMVMGTTADAYDLSQNHAIGGERRSVRNGVATDPAILANDDPWTDSAGTQRYFMGCTSCHGIHRSYGTNQKLLRNNVAGTGPVCLNCHSDK